MTQQRTEEWDGWDGSALFKLIHDKTWNGEFWGQDGAIALALKQFNQLVNWRTDKQARAAAHSSLSSTYYSAAGNALARFSTTRFIRKVLWAFRSLRYFREADRLSDEAKRYRGGLRGMTANELNVRSSIKRKKRDWPEALACIEEALSRSNLNAETQALLLAGKAEILDHQRRYSEAGAAIMEAVALEPEVRVQTKVRIQKALANHYARQGWRDAAREVYLQAFDLAHGAGGMGDQEAKIRALLAQLPK